MSKQLDPSEIMAKYELDTTDKRIFTLIITYPTMSDKDIAGMVGLHRSQVCRRTNKDKFKNALSEFYKPPIQILREGLSKAARNLIKFLDSDDARIRFMASVKLLQSEGLIKTRQEDSNKGFEPLTIEFDSNGSRVVISDPSTKELPKGEI